MNDQHLQNLNCRVKNDRHEYTNDIRCAVWCTISYKTCFVDDDDGAALHYRVAVAAAAATKKILSS